MKKLALLAGLALCAGASACTPNDNRYDNRYDASRSAMAPADRPMMDHDMDHRGMMEEKARYMFTKKDMNGDGYISRAEERAACDRMFRMADTNHDGRVSFDEFLAAKRMEMQDFHENRGTNTRDWNDNMTTTSTTYNRGY